MAQFPVTSEDFKNAVPNPSASLCEGFTDALLKLPSLLWKFISTVIDQNGNVQVAFLRMVRKPGTLIWSASASAEDASQLLADGREIAKADYPDLYAAIGDVWGTPTSALLFKLPNLSGRFLLATGNLPSGTPVAIGQQGGEEKHAFTVSEFDHSHTTGRVKSPNDNTMAFLTGSSDKTGAGQKNPGAGGSTPGSNAEASIESLTGDYLVTSDMNELKTSGAEAGTPDLTPFPVMPPWIGAAVYVAT